MTPSETKVAERREAEGSPARENRSGLAAF